MSKIKELIEHHTQAKSEAWFMLEELNKMDLNKVTVDEAAEIKHQTMKLEEEYYWRDIFTNDLENLL